VLDLAETASASSRPDAAATHLAAARTAFSDLKIPFYAGRAAKVADSLHGAAQASSEGEGAVSIPSPPKGERAG
jgi:hypothetical protein